MAKQRLDQLLVDRGLSENRSRAQAMIMAGEVEVAGKRVDKPGSQVRQDADVRLKASGRKWASRGAFKLLRGIEHFEFDAVGKTAIDVGASTGGFTDVLLDRGAACVYAVDVGHGQLDWRLRNDPRVVVMERTNARYLSAEQIDRSVDIVVCDASFISLKKVLPAALSLCHAGAWLCCLIKPQFEAERSEVGKGGVVRDSLVHERICAEMVRWLGEMPNWTVSGVIESPITGPSGNKEFLIAGRKTAGL